MQKPVLTNCTVKAQVGTAHAQDHGYPGLAGYGIILRYKKSYFYFITIIIIAVKEDESRVLSMPWENLDSGL